MQAICSGDQLSLIHILGVERTGMPVLMLLREIRNHLPHNVEQVVLEIFQIERIDVVGTFLHHDRAGGVVRRDAAGAVLDVYKRQV